MLREIWRRGVAFFDVLQEFSQLLAKIDEINAKILRELSRDGRLTNLQLAERVGLSPSASLRRVQELERQGVITGYRAVLNKEALGKGFVALVAVGLNDHSTQSQEAFEDAMVRAEVIAECHNITGSIEYFLRVECEDLAAYKYFHSEVLGRLPQVHSITTHVVMGSPKDERA